MPIVPSPEWGIILMSSLSGELVWAALGLLTKLGWLSGSGRPFLFLALLHKILTKEKRPMMDRSSDRTTCGGAYGAHLPVPLQLTVLGQLV